jgi:hypothetical protein
VAGLPLLEADACSLGPFGAHVNVAPPKTPQQAAERVVANGLLPTPRYPGPRNTTDTRHKASWVRA